MKIKTLDSIAIECFNEIDFIKRYKSITHTHGSQNERMTLMNKTKNLEILRNLNPDFKLTSPGQLYVLEQKQPLVSLKFMCQISKGLIAPYIKIVSETENLYQFNKLYRRMLNDETITIYAPTFKTYEELEIIVSQLYKIFKDFMVKFQFKLNSK